MQLVFLEGSKCTSTFFQVERVWFTSTS